MDQATLATLKKSANEAGCKKMEDKYYDEFIMDVPKWTLTYEDKSIVFFDFSAPDALNAFCKKMDETLDTLKWEKVE